RMRAYTVERGQLQLPFEAGESSGDFLLSAGTRTGRVPTVTPAAPPPAEPVSPVLRAGATKVNAKDGLTYVWIPPGTFTMGCSPNEGYECGGDDYPTHQVTITNGFWIGQTEVTQKVYGRVIGSNPSELRGDTLPVVRVKWSEAGG